MRKAVALLRVSTGQQAERYGLEVQAGAIKTYARQNDLEIVATYTDVESGSSEKRTELYRLLAEAEGLGVEVVVFFDLTRLARTERLSHEYLHLIVQAGLEPHATNRGLIESNLYTSLDMAISAEERRNIVRRLRGGVIARADAGLPPQGVHLFGYRNVPNALPVIEPDEARHMRRLYKIAAEADSWREVSRQADSEGIPSPRGDGTWQHNNIRRTITNPAYKGELIWPRGTKTPSKTAPRTIRIPAIVSEREWQAAQKPAGVGRKPQGFTPLSGHLRCGECGFGFSVQLKRNQHLPDRFYYRCNSRGRLAGRCAMPTIRAADFEAAVDAELRRVMKDEVELKRLLQDAEMRRAPDPRLVELREREAAFVKAFGQGDLTPDEFSSLRRQVKTEMAAFDTVASEASYPLEEYREAADTLSLKELADHTRLTVIVLKGGFKIVLGGVK